MNQRCSYTKTQTERKLTMTIKPITIRQDEQPKQYAILTSNPADLRATFCNATEKALAIMLENGLTIDPDRKAIWYYQDISQGEPSIDFTTRVGTTFPNIPGFAENCRLYCMEKVLRNKKHTFHLTSHESRNPENNEWGGSAQITFELISSSGDVLSVICTDGQSGLKEWEDLVLGLAKYRCLGLLKFEDAQTQEILRRADASIKDAPTAKLKDLTITEYAKLVFDAIDAYLADEDYVDIGFLPS